MADAIDDVLIVGASDTGLLAGLALDRSNPDLDVSIVSAGCECVPTDCSSSFLGILDLLHGSLGLDEERFVSTVKPVWKTSQYFRDWCDTPPFHYPFDVATKFPPADTADAVESLYYYYDHCFRSPDHRTKGEAIVEQGKSPWYVDPDRGDARKYNVVAYHLDTDRFVSYLRDRCRNRDVRLFDDRLTRVEATGDRVERIQGEKREYEADLYLDATGSARRLVDEFGTDFVAFPFPLDAGYTATFDRPLGDVVPATVVESGDHGWFWQVDTYENRMLGYVYASDFAADGEARAAFLARSPPSVSPDDVTAFTFSSGYHDPAWQENCVAVGDAAGYVEPLQSTRLTGTTRAVVTLGKLLSANGRRNSDGIRDNYNTWVRRYWESVGDFVGVHYRYADGETDFWDAVSSVDPSPRVEHLIEVFDRTGFDTNVSPTATDPGVDDFVEFHPRNLYTVMRSMGATSRFYEANDVRVSEAVREAEDDRYRTIAEQVATHYTTEELYTDVLGL